MTLGAALSETLRGVAISSTIAQAAQQGTWRNLARTLPPFPRPDMFTEIVIGEEKCATRWALKASGVRQWRE